VARRSVTTPAEKLLDKRNAAVVISLPFAAIVVTRRRIAPLPVNPFYRILFCCLACLTCAVRSSASSPPSVYALAHGDRPSDIFELSANGIPVPVLAHTPLYDYAHLSADGAITLIVTVPEPVQTWHISPTTLKVQARVEGRRLILELPHAAYLIAKINDLKEIAIAIDQPESDIPPASGGGIYNVAAAPYRADATGHTLVTHLLQRAIDDAHAAGGGIVYFPPGTFLSASLQLRSNVSLYLAGGATLRSSGDPAHFPTYYRKDSLQMEGTWLLHTEPGSENIRIFGRGTIDGNARELRGRNRFLNNLVVPLQTSRFTIAGVVLRDSGLWGLIPTRSDRIVIRDTKHFNEVDAFFENDAMDIIECQDVLVSHTFAISEDDTYSTKTWFKETDIAVNWPGDPEPLENVLFEDCLAWSRCATFKVGFGCFQPQRNIVFRNSTAYRSMRAIAINRLWGTAAAENVTFENIVVEGFQPRERDRDKCRWLDINTGAGAPVVNVLLKDVTVLDVGYHSSRIEGHSPTAGIDRLRLENVMVGGQPASSLDDLGVGATNSYVTEVSFGTPAR